MKALRMVAVGAPLELQEVPAPALDLDGEKDHNQVIVRVRACGLCGTDLHHLRGTARVGRLPVTLGHEIAGVVEEVGPAVTSGRLSVPSLREGDRVVVHNVIYCGECRACRRGRYNFCSNQLMFGRDVDGGLAEFLKVPARNLVRLPENVTFPEGAILGCGVVTAFHALQLAAIRTGEAIAVWGVGGVGLALVHLAREVSGAYPIIALDRKEHLLELAGDLGADHAIDVTREDPVGRVLALTEGEGAEVTFDTAGITEVSPSGAILTLESTCSGGHVIVVATYPEAVRIQPHDELGIFEKKFTGSCGNLPHELADLAALVAGRRRLDLVKLIGRNVGLEDVNEVLDGWETAGSVGRVVVTL